MIKKKFNMANVLAIVAVLFSSAVWAQGDASKIAVVDVQRAVLQTEKAQTKLKELEQQPDYKTNFENFKALEAEYKKMIENYEKERAVMSAEKRDEEERRILDKQQDIKYIASKLQQTQKEYVEQIMQEQGAGIQTVLQNLVGEQGIGLLLRSEARAILHADESYDISDQLTERLNAIK